MREPSAFTADHRLAGRSRALSVRQPVLDERSRGQAHPDRPVLDVQHAGRTVVLPAPAGGGPRCLAPADRRPIPQVPRITPEKSRPGPNVAQSELRQRYLSGCLSPLCPRPFRAGTGLSVDRQAAQGTGLSWHQAREPSVRSPGSWLMVGRVSLPDLAPSGGYNARRGRSLCSRTGWPRCGRGAVPC